LRNSIFFILKDGATSGAHAAQALALLERLPCVSGALTLGNLDHL